MADGSSKMDMYPTLGNRTDAKEEASGRTRLRQEQPSATSGCGVGEEDRISLAGPNPQFFIIMEYCEKGSLRQVLDSDYTLTWIRKADMCLDAARGLYRLHNTEEKWKVHGSINSSKFLVTKDYTVKLGGFRLPKTETSLKRQTEDRAMRSLCYYCPEKLHNASFSYCKEWEMYSFGIILWEIVTCKNPFEAFSDEEIYQKVCKEKYQEPLPDDCPAELGQLINECRAYDGFQRPSAGVLLDKLRSVVTQMEEQQD